MLVGSIHPDADRGDAQDFYGTFQNLGSSAGLSFPQGVSGIDLNPKPMKAMNFSLSVQQDIGYGVIVDVGYEATWHGTCCGDGT